jgi:hypothetical protein
MAANFCFGQSIDYGITVIYNSSSQTNSDPTLPEDGTSQWNYVGTWGAGIYALKNLSSRFATTLSLNYQQKGYKENAQVIYVPGGPVYYEQLKNIFNYLNADLALQYRIFSGSSLTTALSLGLEYSYLLGYVLESDFFPINNYYPVSEYQDQWEKSVISILPSISLIFDQATTLEFGFNGSLSPVLKTENLIVKDWIWTFRLSHSIPAVFKKTVN